MFSVSIMLDFDTNKLEEKVMIQVNWIIRGVKITFILFLDTKLKMAPQDVFLQLSGVKIKPYWQK